MSGISGVCTMIFPDVMVQASKSQTLSESEMVKQLQGSDNDTKIEILRSLIIRMSNGEKFPKTHMSLMNCLNSDNKTVKKLALYIWEVVDRRDEKGQLLPEMILVCNALKLNLEHPNEYIRGVTLRLVSKLLEEDILHPLIPSIELNLKHHHSYVRKCSVMTVMNISKHLPDLVSHFDDILYDIVTTDHDLVTRRNALLALTTLNTDRAIDYFLTISNILHIHSEGIILAVIELILKTYHTHPSHRTSFINALLLFISKPANSTASSYEASKTLLSISKTPSTIEQALGNLIKLLVDAPDHNVKLSILLEFHSLSNNPRYISLLQGQLMTIIRILESTDIQIRIQALQLALKLCTHQTVNDLILYLRKELLSLSEHDSHPEPSQMHVTSHFPLAKDITGGSDEFKSVLSNAIHSNVDISTQSDTTIQLYRHTLLKTLHQLSVQYPSAMTTVAPLLGSFLADTNPTAALNALQLIKEVMFSYKALRGDLVLRLLTILPDIRIPEVARGVVWILGEFAGTDYTSSLTPPQSAMALSSGSGGALIPSSASASASTDVGLGGASSSSSSSAMPVANDIFNVILTIEKIIGLIGLHSFIQRRFEYENRHHETSESASSSISNPEQPTPAPPQPPTPSYLRSLLIHADMLFASTLAVSLTKLFLRLHHTKHQLEMSPSSSLSTPAPTATPEERTHFTHQYNRLHASIMLLLTRILQHIPQLSTTVGAPGSTTNAVPTMTPAASVIALAASRGGRTPTGTSTPSKTTPHYPLLQPEDDSIGIGYDTYERIGMCVRVLLDPQLSYPSPLGDDDVHGVDGDHQHRPPRQTHWDDNIYSKSSLALAESIRHNMKRDKEIKEMSKNTMKSSSLTSPSLSASVSPNQVQNGPESKDITAPIPIRLLRKNMEAGDEGDGVDLFKDIQYALTGIPPPSTSTHPASGGVGGSNHMAITDSAYSPAPRIHQLTGFADLIYAEVQLILSEYDLLLEFSFVNQTTTPLENIHIELQCSNDLEIVQYPPRFSLGADYDSRSAKVKCQLRVNNTESGTISGSLVCGSGDKHVILFSPLHIGITQYIVPSSCSEVEFRSKWAEFLWENKVLVSTNIHNTLDYLHHIKTITNMHCLTTINNNHNSIIQSLTGPKGVAAKASSTRSLAVAETSGDPQATASDGDSDVLAFLAANLYAVSVFGEAALLNVSVELKDGKLTGYLRIRAKTEGIARGIGEILKSRQRRSK